MVIVIHQASSTANAFFYNERKAKEGKATFYQSKNTPSANPFVYSTQYRNQVFKRIEDSNTRTKNKGLHISFNPTINDMFRLGEKGIRTEINGLMEHLGYGRQPYFVYKHADIDRVHFHIVSTRIDKQTGKKIKDNFEKDKVQEFIKELEQKYQLNKVEPQEKVNLGFTAYNKNLKHNLESLFRELNRMDFIISKQMYGDALKLFHIEIRQVQKGHLVFVTDEQGNPVRYPIKLSEFEDKPMFYQTNGKNEVANIRIKSDSKEEAHYSQKSRRIDLLDLLRLIPDYKNQTNLNKTKRRPRKTRKRLC
jgi:hypothetical protein